MYLEIIKAGVLSASLTIFLTFLLINLGKKGKAGNLYAKIRGGTPRAVGLAPFLVLIIFFPAPYNILIAIIGFLAFVDDVSGRMKIRNGPVEWGQLCRGLGMLLVMLVSYPYFGWASILLAFMIQPMNIADMQPGSACTTVLTMSAVSFVLMVLNGSANSQIPLLVLLICIAYAPLDYRGRIMMGEVGNHSFAIALGISYYMVGGVLSLVILFICTVILIAFIRRKNLEKVLEKNYLIENPNFGDYVMDVLSGGGLGDFIRKIVLKKRKIDVNNSFLEKIGFRRLLYNPFSYN